MRHSGLRYEEGGYNIPKPAALGHEGAGSSEVMGDRVSCVQPGDPMVMFLSVFRGLCEPWLGETRTCAFEPPSCGNGTSRRT